PVGAHPARRRTPRRCAGGRRAHAAAVAPAGGTVGRLRPAGPRPPAGPTPLVRGGSRRPGGPPRPPPVRLHPGAPPPHPPAAASGAHVASPARGTGASAGDVPGRLAADSRTADNTHIDPSAPRVLRAVAEHVVRVREEYPDESRLVEHQANLKRRHLPIRQLF